MTREQMLHKLDISDTGFKEFLAKFRRFYASLTPSEAGVVNVLMPNFQHIAKVLGGDVTRDELKSFLTPPAPAAVHTLTAAAAPGDDGGGGNGGQSGINQMTN